MELTILFLIIVDLIRSSVVQGQVHVPTDNCKSCEAFHDQRYYFFQCVLEVGPETLGRFCRCRIEQETKIDKHGHKNKKRIPSWKAWYNKDTKTCTTSQRGPCGENGMVKVACDAGLICDKDTRTCINEHRPKNGHREPCEVAKHCQDGLICDKDRRMCIRPKSLKFTDYCSVDNECEDGFKCMHVGERHHFKLNQCCKSTQERREPSYNRNLPSELVQIGEAGEEIKIQHGYIFNKCCKNADSKDIGTCTGINGLGRQKIPSIMILLLLTISIVQCL